MVAAWAMWAAWAMLAAGWPPPARGSPGAPAAFALDSTVLLNEAARREREVSYKIRAELRVLPAARAEPHHPHELLKFELVSPQLLWRGKHANADYLPLASAWDDHAHSSFYARLSGGLVQQLYLDPAEPIDVQNFKRSLVSLFQLQVSEAESNETDVSGECVVRYEAPAPTTIRKIKRGCRAAGWPQHGGARDELQSRRLTRYSLSAAGDALEEVYAEELHTLGAAAAGAGLKARAWARLTRTPLAPTAPTPLPTLAAALESLSPALQPASLAAAPPTDLHAADAPRLSAEELGALAARAGGAAPGAGGSLTAARAALALLDALRHAAPAALAGLLHDGVDAERLSGLCAALGLAGSAAAHGAAAAFLRLRERDAPHHLAHQYFAALAQAPHAQEAVLDDVLQLGDELHDAALAESALLAAAAAARSEPAARRVRDALVRGLARCADDECRRVRLAALGNLRRADTAALLLDHAARGGAAAGAALDALDALLTARGALPPDAPARLERVALDGGAALEARAAALDLLLRVAAPAPFSLPRVLLRLREQRAHELQRLAWQRLHALAPRHEPVRLLLRLLPPALRSWDALALPGSSSLLEREVARGAGAGAGWRALLESRQVARGALLRRGRVRLLTLTPDNRTDDTLTVELWTRGLDAFAGAAAEGEGEGEAEAEEAGGGLALGVGGARLRALTLFRGQAELLGHVWAGTASEPTPALRALRPAAGAHAVLPLLGGAALRYERAALLAAALDADAQVSLWARTARTRLQLRSALVARGRASVRAAWGALTAHAHSELEPRLRIDADLDFYDAVALCVRARTEDHWHSYNVTLTSEMGTAKRRVRRSRTQRWAWAGRTLALGAPNDATCRAMGAARD
ncbi:microsomal triacylglycerol transfer protein [Maniola jurtina]|uniref:microsomal triacylglycerol transfer protein n=1 Tax=Maniola jurtina TaxID=191418 RepID=UPI001E6860B9|nr:microsomal triacylglycerol transfer protein [Maniola jurtina]